MTRRWGGLASHARTAAAGVAKRPQPHAITSPLACNLPDPSRVAQPAAFWRDVCEVTPTAHVASEHLSDVIECGVVLKPRDPTPAPRAVDEAAQRTGKPARARLPRRGLGERAAVGLRWRLLHSRR